MYFKFCRFMFELNFMGNVVNYFSFLKRATRDSGKRGETLVSRSLPFPPHKIPELKRAFMGLFTHCLQKGLMGNFISSPWTLRWIHSCLNLL